MVGMQYASLMHAARPTSSTGVVNYHFFVPSPKMNFPGIEDFLKKYQAQAKDAGVDPLGFYQPPFAYAAMQVLEQAIKATGSLNDDKLAEYIHKNAFNTIVGEIKLQRARRMGDRAPDRGAVPEHAGQRARPVHDRPQAGDRLPARVQGRRVGGSRLRSERLTRPMPTPNHRRRGAREIRRVHDRASSS